MFNPTSARAAPFKSAYGPNYHYQPQFKGITAQAATRMAWRTASIGGGLGVAALLFVSGIPRIQIDILQKIPIVGQFYVRPTIDPADNPF